MTCLRHHPPFVILALLMGLMITGCERSGSGSHQASTPSNTAELAGTLRLSGSSTMTPLMSEISQRFHTLHPKVIFVMETGGSSKGVADVRAGAADIGMAARVLAADEKGVTGFPVARDGVGLLVHKNNPLQTLSQRDVVAIFTGKSRNWEDVGGPHLPITVVARDQKRGLTMLFLEHFKLNYDNIQAQKVAGDNAIAFDAVRDDVAAITLISVVAAERAAVSGLPVKLLELDGVAATNRNIITGNYPLTRPLTLVTKEVAAPLVQRFIEFSLSSQATDLIQKLGFVPYQE